MKMGVIQRTGSRKLYSAVFKLDYIPSNITYPFGTVSDFQNHNEHHYHFFSSFGGLLFNSFKGKRGRNQSSLIWNANIELKSIDISITRVPDQLCLNYNVAKE